jgi:hypothetical protein
MTTGTPTPANEYVTFLQYQLPGLDAGSYELDISQHVNDSRGQPISGDTLSRTYRFAIAGDRFRLTNPSATVASTFPASNATGEFATVLPHVAFVASSFPWTRYPTRQPPPLPAPDQDTDVPAWLAVLVLDDDDATAFSGLTLDPVTAALGDLFPPGVYDKSTLGTNYSYFTGAADTGGLDAGEAVADPVQIIDVPLALFADIAPTLEDLKLTAHVRRLSVQNKPAPAGAKPSADPIGTFSIVVGNRLPQPGKRSHAYLVSLESLESFLPATGDGGTLTDATLDPSRALRLAVLAHWTFNTNPTADVNGETVAFVPRLELLNGRAIGGPDAGNTNLRLAVPGASPPISTALEAGYVPLNHDLRTNETTVSWYRGPLSPVALSPGGRVPSGVTLPISSPDQALAFDPTTGMFDASLAAAWTVGRLMALQDQSYASSLYAWKKELTQDAVDSVEAAIIQEAFGGLLAPPPAVPPPAAQAPPAASAKALLHDTMRLLKSAGAS